MRSSLQAFECFVGYRREHWRRLVTVLEGLAQQKCRQSERTLRNNNHTQQHIIDVGDVPGHQVRILDYRTPLN
jgi:hypothetical protein